MHLKAQKRSLLTAFVSESPSISCHSAFKGKKGEHDLKLSKCTVHLLHDQGTSSVSHDAVSSNRKRPDAAVVQLHPNQHTNTHCASCHLWVSYVIGPEYFRRLIAWFPHSFRVQMLSYSQPLHINPFFYHLSFCPCSQTTDLLIISNSLLQAQHCEWFNICPVMSPRREEEEGKMQVSLHLCRAVGK